jgi:molybdopterin converting factor small subunit
MKVEIRLYGSLRRYRPADAPGGPHTPFSLMLPPGTTVGGLSDVLGLPEGLDGLAAVNDEAIDSATILKDSDKVAFFPPSAGGAGANRV